MNSNFNSVFHNISKSFVDFVSHMYDVNTDQNQNVQDIQDQNLVKQNRYLYLIVLSIAVYIIGYIIFSHG